MYGVVDFPLQQLLPVMRLATATATPPVQALLASEVSVVFGVLVQQVHILQVQHSGAGDGPLQS